MAYIYHTNGRHGFISVKRKELSELGILDKISSYSYQKGNTVYLEEDRDATTFIEAKFKTPESFDDFKSTLKESYKKHTPIINYDKFKV